MTGRDLSHYHVIDKLGEGGMGVVYKARDTRLDRFAAVKVLPADKMSDPQRRQRFVTEARAASALNHPNVVTIYDVGSEGDVDFIAMEFVAGRSLDRLIPRQGMRVPDEMLVGRPPFSGDTKMATLAAILDREPDPMPAAIPRDLNRIVTRCLRKNPAKRFQTMADLRVALEELKEESESGRLTASPELAPRRASRWPLAVGAVALLLAVGTGVWIMTRPAPALPAAAPNELRQLTFDSGETSWPSLSPDAKLVAYQSDRAGAGRFDIWVQQTSGGPPIRLTQGPGDHRRPSFSGDGSKVFFESTGPPQGIYEISALGGDPRLLAPNATGVSVSPDGQFLAYVGRPSAQLFVLPAAGREPRAIAPGFAVAALRPIWFWDSAHVAVPGRKAGQAGTSQ